MSNCCRSRQSFYSNPGPDTSTVIVALAMLLILAWLFVGCCHSIDQGVGTQQTIVATVTDKNIKRVDDTDKYLIYTTTLDGTVTVMEITDSLFAGRFDSSDVYAGIEIGKTYQFTLRGKRNHVLSWYPNIYSYSEVSNA